MIAERATGRVGLIGGIDAAIAGHKTFYITTGSGHFQVFNEELHRDALAAPFTISSPDCTVSGLTWAWGAVCPSHPEAFIRIGTERDPSGRDHRIEWNEGNCQAWALEDARYRVGT